MTLLTAMTLAGLAWRIRSLVSPERSLPVQALIESPEIDQIDSLFKMGLARCRRVKFPSPVVKTERHVRRLLNLGNQKASISSVNRARSDIYGIPFSRSNYVQDLVDCPVLAPVIELLRSHVPLEATIHLCTRLSIHDIPYLRLSERVVSFSSHLIIRMHLNGKLVIDIKELDEKRELTSIIIIHIFTHYPFKISLHDFADGIARQPSVADY